MPLTVVVRSAEGARLTFDGLQRVVIGRGPGSDVRLPDPSVSHRHAILRAQGSDFVLIDDGSTNGTFVGSVRIAPRTSRIVHSGDLVRIGRIWLELRIDQSSITRDVAGATRDLALALVSRALDSKGVDASSRVRVVEGRDQGGVLCLIEEERPYVIGRDAGCDLSLADADVSREHVVVISRSASIFVRDLGAKNGTQMGDVRLAGDRETLWRPTQMVKVGRTVLALEVPLADALADLEAAPDEPLGATEFATPTSRPDSTEGALPSPQDPTPTAANVATAPTTAGRAGWSVADVLVMVAALGVLALSLAGLVWLLRG
jgi:pSer/pThr/pTyr-binding forkhead associated (FHA) protein